MALNLRDFWPRSRRPIASTTRSIDQQAGAVCSASPAIVLNRLKASRAGSSAHSREGIARRGEALGTAPQVSCASSPTACSRRPGGSKLVRRTVQGSEAAGADADITKFRFRSTEATPAYWARRHHHEGPIPACARGIIRAGRGRGRWASGWRAPQWATS